jgi:HAD superfamily hydrolase (TIGR01549 family)
MGQKCVVLDIGEVLVDETRVWSVWSEVVGVPRFTLMAALGGAIARGQDHVAAFAALGVDDWEARADEVETRLGGLNGTDLYWDARAAPRALAAAGYRVAVAGNQPVSRAEELARAGIDAEVMLMSDALGVAKPDPAFFTAVLNALNGPEPGNVAYVGDRVDNDVAPAAAAGLRAVWLRRGPWGALQQDTDGAAALVVRTLGELVDRIDETFS